MAISGVSGNQPIQPNDSTNTQNIDKQVQEYKNSIFEQCDTDKSGKIDAKNKNGENEVKTFNQLVRAFINKITGAGENAVNEVTNQPSTDSVQPEFEADGNVKTDVTHNEDGSKDIKAGNETIHVEKDGNSFSVQDNSGRNVSITKAPDGGFEFKDESGEVHKFDKDLNPID